MERMFRWRVTHPDLGSVEVIAPERLKALTTASRQWKVCWTHIARACTIEELGNVEE